MYTDIISTHLGFLWYVIHVIYINFTPKDYQLSVKVGKHLSYTPDNLDS